MSECISISGRPIGVQHAPFIIAEMSGNHNKSLERALEIVEAAAWAGADAIKIQTYTPDTMTIDLDEREFHIDDPKSLWRGTSLYALYREAHTPWDWHHSIFRRASELGIVAFSSPFDASAVDFLEELGAPCYKIASFENTDLPLIRRAAATGKPLIISTGMATEEEIRETVEAAYDAGCSELILLKCTSAYPADASSAHLRTISDMRERFRGCEVGLSDHTPGVCVAVAAVVHGASVIEKHFTLRRADGGVDSAFSLEPEEMIRLVHDSRMAWRAAGCVHYGPTAEEKASLQFRRSLYVVEDIREGEVFTEKTVRAIRPGHGLPPKFRDLILGKKAARDIRRGTALRMEMISDPPVMNQPESDQISNNQGVAPS